MRHGAQTIVISTTEQAQAMLDHLEECRERAQADNYASERKKPIKSLSCTCCGDGLKGRDWWNQEPGYGLCDHCVSYCHAPTEPGQESSTYGVCGVHYLVPKSERDNPPLVEDRGAALYGLDSRLRIEYDGFVYWKGRQIEHFSGRYLESSEETIAVARDLIRRCETLESRGVEVNTNSVIWSWKE